MVPVGRQEPLLRTVVFGEGNLFMFTMMRKKIYKDATGLLTDLLGEASTFFFFLSMNSPNKNIAAGHGDLGCRCQAFTL